MKLAAHYMLSPEGKFIKWPVISVASDGMIEHVKSFPNGFKEEPGVSFYPGILVPALIDVFGEKTIEEQEFPRFLNRLFADGTLAIGLTGESFQMFRNRPPFIVSNRIPEKLVPAEKSQGSTVFVCLKSNAGISQKTNLAARLNHFTLEAARAAGLKYAGALSEGYAPGVLLLRGIDFVNLKMLPTASVQWLNVPDAGYYK